jgi:hypothetical protein
MRKMLLIFFQKKRKKNNNKFLLKIIKSLNIKFYYLFKVNKIFI